MLKPSPSEPFSRLMLRGRGPLTRRGRRDSGSDQYFLSLLLSVFVCTHSGSAVCVSVLSEGMELLVRLSTCEAMALMLVSATT